MILMKVSDISNEARPMDVAMPWLDCLLMEFFNQVFHTNLCCVCFRKKNVVILPILHYCVFNLPHIFILFNFF